jgi:hypothetical protein
MTLSWFPLLGGLHLKLFARPGLTTCNAVIWLRWTEANRLHQLLDLVSDPAVWPLLIWRVLIVCRCQAAT